VLLGLKSFTTTALQTPSSLWLETDLPTPAVYLLRVLPAIQFSVAGMARRQRCICFSRQQTACF